MPSSALLRVTSLHGSADLTPQAEEWLTTGLTAALPGLRMRELFDSRLDMFREAHLITVVLDGETIVGVLSSRWCPLRPGTQFLHVTTQFVAETHRHGTVFRQCWRSHFAELLSGGAGFPRLIALKTYNPVVYCAMRAFTAAPQVTMYPALGAAQDGALAALAVRVAERIVPGRPFDPTAGRIRSAGSPAGLYPEMPVSRDADVNAFFASTLEPGDRILCLLRVPTQQGAASILGAFGLTP